MSTAAVRTLPWPSWILLPLLFGYLTMTRSFAHLGVAPFYIGEAALGFLLVFHPSVVLGPWLGNQLRRGPYTQLARLTFLFIVFGFLQCVRGLESDYPKIALQNFAFNFYIAFLFAGMWLANRRPELLPRVIWFLAWANGLYGVAYLGVLGRFDSVDQIHAGDVGIFGQPAGSAIALLGLLAYERNLRRAILPLLLNAFVLLGMQMRAEWLGFAIAVTVLSYLTGQVSRLVQAGIVVGGLLAVGLLVDFKIPSPSSRGGTISTRDIVGRAISAVDKRAAASLTRNAGDFASTVDWRTKWWENIVRATYANPKSTLIGGGYGYPIWLHNAEDQRVNRTPHNIFMFNLAYTGWLGVMVFYALQLCLAWNLWRAYRATGQPFGFCLWILVFVWAHFDNYLEAPYGAIPFYLLAGMALTSAIPAWPEPNGSAETLAADAGSN